MTPRPKRSRFMGRDYSITFLPSGSVKTEAGDECWGTTSHEEQKIDVEDNLIHDKERETVLHETLHQLFNSTDFSVTDETEELICTYFGRALLAHMRDNKQMWRYLTQAPPKPCPTKSTSPEQSTKLS